MESDDRINQTLPADINDRIRAFADAIPGLMLYANPDMLGRLDASVAGKLPLWQAEYKISAPRDVASYARIGWQYREDPDESTFTDAVVLAGKAPAFPLPAGSYFGPRSGPKTSVSGYYSHRADLRRWQQRMHDRGWTIGADGLYGGQTANIARQFQAEKGLHVDGLIGPDTWAAAWETPVTR